MNHYYAVTRSKKNDELQHWKYVKKYKKNGKWRYVYNVGTTGDQINGKITSPYREYTKIQDVLGFDERDAAGIAEVNYHRADDNARAYNHSQTTNSKYYNQAKSDALYKQAKVAGKIASKSVERYYKTPLGKLDKAVGVVNKGREKVANALSKLSEAVKPKERSLISKTGGTPYKVGSHTVVKRIS